MSDPGAPTPADLRTGSRRLVWGTSAQVAFVAMVIAMVKFNLVIDDKAALIETLVAASLLLIGQNFILQGWWRLTAPAHARTESDWKPRLRLLSRALSVLPLGTAAIGVVALTLPNIRWAPQDIAIEGAAAAFVLFPFAIAAAVAAQCIVIRTTHRTLRDTPLARLSEATALIAVLFALAWAALLRYPAWPNAAGWIFFSGLLLVSTAHLLVALRLHAHRRHPAAPTPAPPPALAPLPA